MMLTLQKPINIILADDHAIFRHGFRHMINKNPNINLVGEASNPRELIAKTQDLQPDIILTDIAIGGMGGIELTKSMVKRFPTLGIIALSMFDDGRSIIDTIDAGAKGYLLKNVHEDEIVAAVKSVYKNETYYCKSTSIRLSKMMANCSNRLQRKVPKGSLTTGKLEQFR